ADQTLQFFTASRGHHADVGGMTPGSMPPFATSLAEEGIVLRAVSLMTGGEFDRERLRGLLLAGAYPARNPAENLADLEAQIAANRTGAELLEQMIDELGRVRVANYMMHVQDHGAACVARAIARLPDGTRRFVDAMDDNTPIAVAITVAGSHMHIDFEGTGPQVDGNLNAPPAVTQAAVLYVLRLLADRSIPLNSGCMRPVSVHVPPGSILAPSPGKAVAAGNVETAQRVVDVLLGALGLAAASQGTMNNLTFGNGAFGYYETIGGGSGACRHAPGASGVHTHMTNTRITDPEVLEARFPVRLWAFGIRRGSGGAGSMPGGDGLIREFEFLEPVSLSILSQRRERAPFGLLGGLPGLPGRNLVAGQLRPGALQCEVGAGVRVRVETPGGGGYGSLPE
ncbi:MAG: hydantoinase B/oxoprolinase family protein, partial [Nannocystaceae bacterium]